MGPAAILMAVSMAMTAAQMAMQMKAQKEQQKAREQAAARQREELKRQQVREDVIAQEQKADVRTKADMAIGTILAQAADNGSSMSAVARMAGGVGGTSGADLARIEGNRNESRERRKAEWINVNGTLAAHATQTKYSIMGTAAQGIGNMASAGYTYATTPNPYKTDPIGAGGGGSIGGGGHSMKMK